jgi:hypothetical protein
VNATDPSGDATLGICVQASAALGIGFHHRGTGAIGLVCLVRTVFTPKGNDDIGFTETVGQANGHAVGVSIGVSAGYQVSNADTLQELGKHFLNTNISAGALTVPIGVPGSYLRVLRQMDGTFGESTEASPLERENQSPSFLHIPMFSRSTIPSKQMPSDCFGIHFYRQECSIRRQSKGYCTQRSRPRSPRPQVVLNPVPHRAHDGEHRFRGWCGCWNTGHTCHTVCVCSPSTNPVGVRPTEVVSGPSSTTSMERAIYTKCNSRVNGPSVIH